MKHTDWLRRLPWTVAVCALGLMLLGLTGIERGDELSRAGEFFSRQIVWIAIATPAMLLATFVPYRICRHHCYLLFAFSLLALVIVFLFPARWGSRRWVPLGLMYFQPSEMAKLACVMALARYLMYRENFRRLTGLLVPFVLTLIPLVLILKEPDLGSAMLFLPALFAMLFAAGARLRHLAFIVALGICAIPVMWVGVMNAEQKSRITALFQQRDGGAVPKGDGYHLHQSKQVLALGGAWGSEISGTAIDDPLAYHLPACRTDFVLCMVGERWGIFGTLGVLALYLVLFGKGVMIAAATREPFGRLLAVGIVALLAGQTLINSGMTVGLMPITGVTLPLLSYGGSSLLFTCLALGLLMNVGMRPGYEIGHDPFRFGKQS